MVYHSLLSEGSEGRGREGKVRRWLIRVALSMLVS